MKTAVNIIGIMFLTCSCMMQRTGSYQNGQQGGYFSTQVFYDELSPYGNWVHNREYGYVWIPHVGRNFYPYATSGRWVMTEYGWTWLSDYKWGWAPFHYGRWDYDLYYGWVWFPDSEWAPAWVTWRQGDGYFGWAPMSPGMNAGMGFQDRNYENDINRWIFVREKDFTKSNIGRYYVNRRQNDDLLRRSAIINNINTNNQSRVSYYSGPDPSEIQRVTGKRLRSVTVRDNDRPGHRLSSNELQIYRPRVENNPTSGNRPAPSRITDIKDIRPMRERNRNYQPNIEREINNPNVGQGQREERNQDQTEIQRERETRRQLQEKQDALEKRQQEIDQQQKQRSRESESPRRIQRDQQQRKVEREQQVQQQKKQMRKERERRQIEVSDSSRSRRQIEVSDSSRSRRSVRERNRTVTPERR